MATKTIRVTEEVYDRLKSRKREDESFSDLLDRLTDRDDQFMKGFGAFADVDFDEHIDELNRRWDDELRDAP